MKYYGRRNINRIKVGDNIYGQNTVRSITRHKKPDGKTVYTINGGHHDQMEYPVGWHVRAIRKLRKAKK